MPCDTIRKPRQTPAERAAEVRKAVAALDKALAAGLAKAVVGKAGGIAFAGFDGFRDGVTDACAYRRIMATGSALARQKIIDAERIAGRAVDRKAVGAGLHSHDGGATWHHGH